MEVANILTMIGTLAGLVIFFTALAMFFDWVE